MRLGAAHIPLSWPTGLPMAGYSARAGLSTGTLQSLSARALVASDASHTVCLLSIDTIAVDMALTTLLRSAIADRYGLQPESVMVTATHTHSAPGGAASFLAMGGSEAFMGVYAPERARWIAAACVEVVGLARSQQTQVQLTVGTGHAEGVGLNRRDPNGLTDPLVPFFRARDKHGVTIAFLLSVACHPTLLDASNTLYSGDLAGVVAARLEAAQGGTVLPLTGAAGDISTRFTRRESSPAELDRLACLLTEGLMVTETIDDDENVAFASTRLTLPLKPAPDPEVLQQALAAARTRLANTAPETRRVVQAEIEGIEVALAAGPRPKFLSTEVQALRLGRTLIIGFPGELFVRYGMMLRESLSPAHLLIAGYANDYVGYVPTPDAAGGYEVDSAIVGKEAGRMLLDGAVEIARQCRPSSH